MVNLLTWHLVLRPKQGKTYDFMTCLDSFAQAEGAEKPRVTLRAQDVLSCSKDFHFADLISSDILQSPSRLNSL